MGRWQESREPLYDKRPRDRTPGGEAMTTKGRYVTGATLLALLGGLAAGQYLLERTALAQGPGGRDTPVFQATRRRSRSCGLCRGRACR